MQPSQDIEQASISISYDDAPVRRPCFSRRKKIMMAVINVSVVAVVLGVFLSKSKSSARYENQLDDVMPFGSSSNDQLPLPASKSVEADYTVTAFDGPLPAFLSARSSDLYRITCEDNQVLTTLSLVTDGHAQETSWEIQRPDGTQLAFGPPTGQKYKRTTSYDGELCLPVGKNVLVMYDTAGDGLCCVYGNGKMTISVNGETLVETGDEDFKTKEYPFELFTNGNINPDSFTTSTEQTTTTTATEDMKTSDFTTTAVVDSSTSSTVGSTIVESTTTSFFVQDTSTSSTIGSTTVESTTEGDYCVTVEVLTDRFGKRETAYSFSSKPKNKSEEPVVYISYEVGDLENEQLYSDTVCVPAGEYELLVEDSYRGLCCTSGEGYYAVKVDEQEILYGGSFLNFPGTSITHDIRLGDDEVSDRANEWLDAHNTRRETFHTSEGTEYKPLVWSDALEKDAESWLDEVMTDCKTVRENGLIEGENLSFRKVGAPRDTEVPENILKRWVDLKKGKSYPANASLTQAMWRATRYVGCSDGSRTLSDGSICYASICRYARAGNCQMGKYDDWKEPTLADRTTCGPICPDDGCH